MIKYAGLFFLFAVYGSVAYTQNRNDDNVHFSAGPEAGIVVGINSAFYGAVLGGTADVEFPLNTRFAANIMSGINVFIGKKIYDYTFDDLSVVPLKAGLKYYLRNDIYGIAQAGAGFFSDGANTKFGYGFGLGYLLHLGNGRGIDFSARADAYTGNGGSIASVGTRIAYRFR